MSFQVKPPFDVFPDVDGDPLEAGFIYIGTQGLDPKSNPISVYWDAALSIPAVQPIRTIGGFPSRAGSPASVFTSAPNYSILVENKNSSLVYSELNVIGPNATSINYLNGTTSSFLGALHLESYAELLALDVATLTDKTPAVITSGTGIDGAGVLLNVPAHGLTDDGGVVKVINSEWYWRRTYSGAVWRDWFPTLQEWVDYCVANSETPYPGTLFDSENTWTVDTSSANFTTVGQAIKFLYDCNVAYRGVDAVSGDNARQYVNIETGFTFSEQVWFEGVNLSFITVTSTDAEVTIDRSALTRPVGSSVIRYMAFCFRFGCTSPVMDVLFNMDTSGTATGRGGCRVEAGSYAYWDNGSGVKNCADRGLHLVNSKAWANSTIWSGCGNRGLRIGNVSEIWAENVDCTNAGESGIGVDSGCMANVRNADCSGAAVYGLLAIGCTVDAEGVTANNCGTNGILAEAGAMVNAESCLIDNAGDSGIEVLDGSRLNAKLCRVTNSTSSNLYVRNGSTADVHGGTLTGAGAHNIYGQNSATIDASGTTATAATSRGCLADASFVNLLGADVSGSGGAADLLVQNGSVVQFNNATGTTGATLNTPASSGLVFG